MSSFTVDCAQPIEWGHPLNEKRRTWHLPQPGWSGAYLPNLCKMNEPNQVKGQHGKYVGASNVMPRIITGFNGRPAINIASANSQKVDCDYLYGIGLIPECTLICHYTWLATTGRVLTVPKDDTGSDVPILYIQTASGANASSAGGGGAPSYNGGVPYTCTVGVPQHVAVVKRAKKFWTYVDGLLMGTATSTSTFSDDGKMYFGTYNGNYNQYSNCIIHSATILDRGLSFDEVNLDREMSLKGYICPDSPLRTISSRSWFVPSSTPVVGSIFSRNRFRQNTLVRM